jgi:L-ascorbate metabolism protein UlaG (beta-lactamase superfamily)
MVSVSNTFFLLSKKQIHNMLIYIILGVIIFIPLLIATIGRAIAAPKYKGPVSDHFDGKKFFNPSGMNSKELGDVIKWQREKREKGIWYPVHDFQHGEKPTPSVFGDNLRVTYIGHSTVLIQFDGFHILTDPVWYERCSPVQWAGPKRVKPAGIRMEDLPKIDLILQSHNHWDHLDIVNLPKIWKRDKPLIINALGVSQFMKKKGIHNAMDLDWWDEHQFTDDIKITCVPAQHFSGRGTSDRNATLWAGYVISTKQGHIYFAGDSGYGNFFKQIGEKFGKMRLALIPIGAFKPQWFMGNIHCSPEEAVQIHLDVNAECSLAIHHSTFPLADDGQSEPLDLLEKAKILRGLSPDDFFVLKEGHFKEV